jgi:hypothetical protein
LNYSHRKTQEDGTERSEEEYHISSGGLEADGRDFLNWPNLDVFVGDRVEFEILATSHASPAPTKKPHDGDAVAHSKKDYVRHMVKQLGWELIEHGPSPPLSESAQSNSGDSTPVS